MLLAKQCSVRVGKGLSIDSADYGIVQYHSVGVGCRQDTRHATDSRLFLPDEANLSKDEKSQPNQTVVRF